MLYQLGALAIQVAPFNAHEVSETGEAEYAVKPVVGREPPLEFVGEGGNEMTISGKLFPHELGGLTELELLRQMRASGKPQYLMRGDGRALGWWAITSVGASHSYLDRKGVGRQIDVNISLRRAQTPSAASFFSLMAGLLS